MAGVLSRDTGESQWSEAGDSQQSASSHSGDFGTESFARTESKPNCGGISADPADCRPCRLATKILHVPGPLLRHAWTYPCRAWSLWRDLLFSNAPYAGNWNPNGVGCDRHARATR